MESNAGMKTKTRRTFYSGASERQRQRQMTQTDSNGEERCLAGGTFFPGCMPLLLHHANTETRM